MNEPAARDLVAVRRQLNPRAQPVGEMEYKQSWPGTRGVVHTGCAEAWRDESGRATQPR